jgi:hypothetical protein
MILADKDAIRFGFNEAVYCSRMAKSKKFPIVGIISINLVQSGRSENTKKY